MGISLMALPTRRQDVGTLLLGCNTHNTVLAEIDSTLINASVYTAHGHRSAQMTPTGRLGFNGALTEANTGWQLLGNGYRAYNPVLMRFHSPDSLSPFGEGGLNAYAYCKGDPVNFTDPTGHGFFTWLKMAKRLVKPVVTTKSAQADKLPKILTRLPEGKSFSKLHKLATSDVKNITEIAGYSGRLPNNNSAKRVESIVNDFSNGFDPAALINQENARIAVRHFGMTGEVKYGITGQSRKEINRMAKYIRNANGVER
jgi:RHS repeat-associated protein